MRILESSQSLLHVLKKEDSQLAKRKNTVSTRSKQSCQQSPEKPTGVQMQKKRVTYKRENLDQSEEVDQQEDSKIEI